MTLYGPPAQVQVVDQAKVLPETESRLRHWEPEVAALAPHRFYTLSVVVRD